MEFASVLLGRRSIRVFEPEPVPRELIRQILEEASWSPSWANTQPWSIYVVTGTTLQRLKAANADPIPPEPSGEADFLWPREWPEHLAARASDLMRSIPAGTAEAREVRPGVNEFFGAPCLVLVAIERGLNSTYSVFDCGALVQSLCLAAENRGLGTCIMAMAVRQPDVLRRLLPKAVHERFVIGVALGYPDRGAPINHFGRARAPLDEVVTWAD